MFAVAPTARYKPMLCRNFKIPNQTKAAKYVSEVQIGNKNSLHQQYRNSNY